jgi:hypothetical protein
MVQRRPRVRSELDHFGRCAALFETFPVSIMWREPEVLDSLEFAVRRRLDRIYCTGAREGRLRGEPHISVAESCDGWSISMTAPQRFTTTPVRCPKQTFIGSPKGLFSASIPFLSQVCGGK